MTKDGAVARPVTQRAAEMRVPPLSPVRSDQMDNARKAGANTDSARAGLHTRDSDVVARAERGADVFASAARHSRRVRVLKFALPVVAVLVSVLFLGYSFFPSVGGSTIGLGSTAIEDGNLVIENPTLDGFTSDRRPYTVTAAKALQAIGTSDAPIKMEEIKATLPIDADDEATISAARGTFDRANDRLTLDTEITFRTTSGFVARLQSAEIDIASNDLTTDKPVEIEMDGMRINADSLHASNGGKKLVFENRVRVEIDPETMRPAQERDGEGSGNE
ncbi:LPS export ABC transporter periplasmic protein LptC [Chelativorans salis]|uniref:LPS export ABC transporter periplasmic protein LptC n=1 Tax=Chelativorans salis TaxID=2978478 RepID=A0ABT2LVM3_9HYPH|nr:LPS export ABC transporter periplasmic protein LptC [Chelativorans sp. EGI FJ00035]MCT7378576.1 LPS export ABC transporter periplasmic protein LptC [Chelativorans sp. EGI FJ00035]